MNDWPHWTRSLLVISAFFWTVYTVAEATTPSSTISGPRGWLSAAQEQQLGGQPLPQHFRAEEAKGQAVQENGCHCGYTAAKLLLSGLVLVLSAFAAGWHLGGRNVSRDAASSAIEGQSPASAAAHSELQGENLIARFQEVASPAEAGKSGPSSAIEATAEHEASASPEANREVDRTEDAAVELQSAPATAMPVDAARSVQPQAAAAEPLYVKESSQPEPSKVEPCSPETPASTGPDSAESAPSESPTASTAGEDALRQQASAASEGTIFQTAAHEGTTTSSPSCTSGTESWAREQSGHWEGRRGLDLTWLGYEQEVSAVAGAVVRMLDIDMRDLSVADRIQLAGVVTQAWRGHHELTHHEASASLRKEANSLQRVQAEAAVDTLAHKQARLATEARLRGLARFREALADGLLTGLALMLATALYCGMRHGVLGGRLARCPPFSRTSRLSFYRPWALLERGSVALCYLEAFSDAVLGAGIMLAAAYVAAKGSVFAGSPHQAPLLKLAIGLGLVCGAAGFVAIGRVGGDPRMWLAGWECWVMLHLLASWYMEPLHALLSRQGSDGGMRLAAYQAGMAIIMPLAVGLLPFSAALPHVVG